MRSSIPLAAVSAGVAALIALGGCDSDQPSATAGSRDASQAATSQQSAAKSAVSPAPSPDVAPTPAAPEEDVAAAIDRAGSLGAGGQVVTTAMVTDLGTGPLGMCTRTAVQTDADGQAQAAEVWAGLAPSTDLASMCDAFTATTHYIAVGTDGYVEVPATSGSYQRVVISPSVLADLTSTSAINQVQQFETLLPQAVQATAQGDGTYQLTFDTLEVAQRAAAVAGFAQDQIAQVSAGTVTLVYVVDATTGLVDSVAMDASLVSGDTTVTASGRTTATWSLDTPISTPSTIVPGETETITTFDQLSLVALGASPTATQGG